MFRIIFVGGLETINDDSVLDLLDKRFSRDEIYVSVCNNYVFPFKLKIFHFFKMIPDKRFESFDCHQSI